MRRAFTPMPFVAAAIRPDIYAVAFFAVTVNATYRGRSTHPNPCAAILLILIPPFPIQSVFAFQQLKCCLTAMFIIRPFGIQFTVCCVKLSLNRTVVDLSRKNANDIIILIRVENQFTEISVPFTNEIRRFGLLKEYCFLFPNAIPTSIQ